MRPLRVAIAGGGIGGLLVRCADIPDLPDPMALQFWAGPRRHLLHYAIDGGELINFLAACASPGGRRGQVIT